MSEHLHELFIRSSADHGTVLTRFAAHRLKENEATDELIDLCEGVAKDSKTLNAKNDSIVYKVDGKCEFFVSRYFYLYPNFTDREDFYGKNSDKRQHRQQRTATRPSNFHSRR